ncbi:ADP-ribosylglycohydrolase [Kribbella amoyensis]|uniref:ADP-ribosylglycohydrolase n=1 Tax=Kribbella amoyensis TaxID=996641 RepID=A0A561BYG5_9ACTN|nr:ADP-ribosylglycohydrolase family protein [Kribbella amoyensis]TWD83732.1 ADP-ribosylglycohydrolase [Kribbella amoyensis]
MHDVLDPRDLVPDEAEQLVSAGYPAEELLDRARQAAADADLPALAAIENELAALQRRPDWPYEEPVTPTDLTPSVATTEFDEDALPDRVTGAWLGRCVGNTMGKPVEGLGRAEVRKYLEAAGDWPLSGFVPYLEEVPAGLTPHPSAGEASDGQFDAIPRDDDLDWTMLGLHVLEKYGRDVGTRDIAREWLDRMPFTQTYTAERVAYRNLVTGLQPPLTATIRNPYREWIGALIRVDIYGYVSPGDPAEAARLALTDALLSHTANGVYGAQWAAALVAQALVVDDVADALRVALEVVPPKSRLAESQRALLDLHASGAGYEQALDWVDEALDYNWVHTLNNAGIITTALLWGEGDYVKTLGIAVGAGRDTDSTAATVGSVFGAVHGASAIPAALVAQGRGIVRSAVRGFDRITVDDLAARTNAVRRSLRPSTS